MADSAPKNEKGQKLMRAVIAEKFGGELQVKMVPIPKPKPGQVLIRMESAQMNPSDLSYIAGKYGIKLDPPFKIGLEGSGVVVENNAGLLGWYLLGKRVTCISTATTVGSWAEYMVTSAKQVVPLPDNISFDAGAGYIVNPMTVMAFCEYMEKHKAAVQTAACSAVGKMFFRMMQLEGKEVINIVRKKEQEETLKGMGAKYILNSEDPDFDKKLKTLSAELGATCFFDALGGDMMWRVFKAMPMFSVCYMFGHLSISPTNKIDASHIIFTQKTIKPFYLAFYVREKGLIDRFKLTSKANRLMSTALKQDISERFPLERAGEGVKYYTENMSKGKVIIKPRL